MPHAARLPLLAIMAASIGCAPVLATPGRLIAAVPFTSGPDPVPAGARAWRIRYETTDRRGRATQSTGMLFAPAGDAPAGGRPVVAWTHGTVGVAEQCAPSRLAGGIAQIAGLDAMLERGWAVVATDYPGLGTPGPHNYLVGEAAARAALNSVRAARAVAEVGAGSRFAVTGHSQGGHAALWTAERARALAPELTLMAVAALSPPTDLAANLAAASPAARALLGSYVGITWSRSYGLPLADLGDRTTQRLMRQLAAGCVGKGDGLAKLRGVRLIVRLRNIDLSRLPRWAPVLRANSAGQRPVGVPMLVAQGLKDVLVAPAVTAAYVRRQCARGERITTIDVPTGDHMIPDAVAPRSVAWLGDRFAGAPDADACR